ncbi:heat shock 70 kDa protein 12A-like [Ruditapes philippinarum]|uniref:heat shock 70 kDa protein 12A-like n=1 Tax=Ruditapes philippinarum TaxID=129788 RepID=UPI00295A9A78|nr:heat shock 70 kDa protein 12A-like [Ruditapes philippinarum]
MLEDETGKQLPAKTVFSLAIEFLKRDILEHCHKQILFVLKEDDIKWVLTVPAIWNDGAKQFMREAAEQAGIARSKLKIALEPEAASLYCRYLPVEKGQEKNSLALFGSGMEYIVLDAGGGTIDITVHQVIVDGKLRELHKASGGGWGGTLVDKAYEQFLSEIAGPETFQQFKEKHMDDYIDLLRMFEFKKRGTSPGHSGKVTFRIPPTFAETIKDATGLSIQDKIMSSAFKGQVTYVSGKARVDVEIVQSFFTQSVDSILQHLASLLGERMNRECTAIVMVGGFSQSSILQDAVKRAFGRRYNVIIPKDAGLAVLKGAVIFGHRPSTISERICKYTYGQKVCHETTRNCNHPPTRTKWIDGKLHCSDIFMKHIKIGQTVKLEEEQMEMITYPPYADQTTICMKIYASKSSDPRLITEPGCAKIGKFVMPIPDTSLGIDRKIGTRFIFGDTEIATMEDDTNTSNFSYSEDDLVKIAEVLKSSFQREIMHLVKDAVSQSASVIVDGVLTGLQEKVNFLKKKI